MKYAFVTLAVVIPGVYVVVAFLVATFTDVFAVQSRVKFALLYGMLAVVAGVADYYRMKYDQDTPRPLGDRQFIRSVIRGHLVAFLFIFLGAGTGFLLDIDAGWPVVLGFLCGPVTNRVLTLFNYYTFAVAQRIYVLLVEVGFSLVPLVFILGIIRGR